MAMMSLGPVLSPAYGGIHAYRWYVIITANSPSRVFRSEEASIWDLRVSAQLRPDMLAPAEEARNPWIQGAPGPPGSQEPRSSGAHESGHPGSHGEVEHKRVEENLTLRETASSWRI
jgi:hypothetical protein